MAFAIFIAGIVLGTILGFVVMTLLNVSSEHCQCEEEQIIGSGSACAYPAARKVNPDAGG